MTTAGKTREDYRRERNASREEIAKLRGMLAAAERELEISAKNYSKLVQERDAWREYAGKLREALEAYWSGGYETVRVNIIIENALALPTPGGEHE